MLTLHNLSVFYDENQVVHAINLNVSPGECVVLTGESGSGKSSIINAINGLGARYDNARIEGTIALDGDELTQKPIYEIAMLVSSVFQNPKTHFFNVDTTQELLFFLENTGVSKKDMQERLQELLSLFPIAHLLNRNIFELSGGEKQILCLASSYIAGCKLILLDEPTSNLDHTYIEILANMLRRLKEQGITLLIAEHRLYYLREILDKLIHIEKGEIKHCYTQSEFIRLSTDELHALGLRSNVDEALSLPELPPYTIENCPTLRIDNLKLSFEKQCNLHVSNLAFHTNYIYGIVGKNGCGKSSFIKSLIGVMKQSKETVFYRDKQCNKRKRISLSSLVMQDVNSQLFSESVEHELTLTQKNISEVSLDSILEQLNIREFKNVHPMSLSGGQKQRVAIATSIVDGAALMYFDEPTSGMDYKNMLAISHCIQSLKSQKRIIFIVSHDVEFLNITCDYILNIERFSTRQLQ
ncbi:ABC transporter ATP-binding protein [Amygdalobacter indicium]|uniref:ABC transporter ATP-binding protein n=1 Tax=Amygdalobacter indicium TaxID=3029272 RepID=UPI0027AA5AA5|nr:ABC transporter ATP-binding protein [Amygdalobacter indicium]WEG34474.1 ABC transporter ATP-binding protein [Amygdalobacter indicium]